MSSLKIPPRTFAVIKPSASVPHQLAQAKTIVSEIAANPLIFVSPNPPIATMNSLIAAAEVSQTSVLTRAVGMVAIRDAKVRELTDSLHTCRGYVEGVANLDPSTATATVQLAGFQVRKPAARQNKPDLEARQGAVSGTVLLIAKATGPRSSYMWQWSLDQKVWTDLPPTLVARTSMVNLAVPVMHFFRFRSLTRAGLADWSQVVSILLK